MFSVTRTAAQVTVAAGLAAAALVISPGTAHAEVPSGPGQIQMAPHVDPQGPKIANPTPAPDPLPVPPKPLDSKTEGTEPKPDPKPDPKPGPQADGPDDLAIETPCTHGCGGGPEGPGDLTSNPEPTDPTDIPDEDEPLDQGCFTGCDLPEEGDSEVTSIATPSRIDAGSDSAGSTLAGNAVDAPETSMSYYAGLGLFSIAGAAGIALAARRLTERKTATRE